MEINVFMTYVIHDLLPFDQSEESIFPHNVSYIKRLARVKRPLRIALCEESSYNDLIFSVDTRCLLSKFILYRSF